MPTAAEPQAPWPSLHPPSSFEFVSQSLQLSKNHVDGQTRGTQLPIATGTRRYSEVQCLLPGMRRCAFGRGQGTGLKQRLRCN